MTRTSLVSLSVLVVFCFAQSGCALLEGEDPGPPPNPRSPEVVSQRERGTERVDAALAEVASALDGAVIGRASSDECYEGQNNWKVHDRYDHRCTLRRAVVVGLDGDFRDRIQRFDQRLFAIGWGCYRTPCPETLSGLAEEYWDLRAAEVGGGVFSLSRLPSTVGYELDDLHLYVDYAGVDRSGRFPLEQAHRRRRGGLFESYADVTPLDIDRVVSRAANVDYVVVLAIEQDYFQTEP